MLVLPPDVLPQHRHLLALRDRVAESKRALEKVKRDAGESLAIVASKWPEHAAGPVVVPQFSFDPDQQLPSPGPAVGANLEDERAELKRQDDLLQKLIAAQKETLQQAEKAVALAQSADLGGHHGSLAASLPAR